MKFLDYIQGHRKGPEAHRIEKDSMRDPFLYEAIEGFDSIDDNHIKRINNIQNRIKAKSQSVKKGYARMWQIAAAVIVIVFGIGGYFMNNIQSSLYAQETEENIIIDIYVPEIYYSENIVPIAEQNARVIREAYKPEIEKLKVNENPNPSTKEKEEISLDVEKASKNNIVIEVYIPKNVNL